MRLLGLDPDQVPAAEERVVWVWEANWPVFRLFTALSTQWRWFGVSGLGGGLIRRTGLDYGAVPPVAAGLEVTMDAEAWRLLGMAEAAAMEVWDAKS